MRMVRTFGRIVRGTKQPAEESREPRATRRLRPGRGRAGRVVALAATTVVVGAVVGAGSFTSASWSSATSSTPGGQIPPRASEAGQVLKGALGPPMIAAGVVHRGSPGGRATPSIR